MALAISHLRSCTPPSIDEQVKNYLLERIDPARQEDRAKAHARALMVTTLRVEGLWPPSVRGEF